MPKRKREIYRVILGSQRQKLGEDYNEYLPIKPSKFFITRPKDELRKKQTEYN